MDVKKQYESGFALMEVVVALAVLSIIIFVFVSLFSLSYSGVMSAGYNSEALYEAQQKMEHAILDTTYSGEKDGEVERTTKVIDNITGQELTVNIDYLDGNGNARTVSLTTFVTDGM